MLHYLTQWIENFVGGKSKPLYCLLYGRDEEQSIWISPMRYLSSFLIGVLLSYLLGLLVSLNNSLSILYQNLLVEVPVVTLFLLLNGLSFMLSRNVRAVTLLIFASIADKAGHKYLRAVAFGFLITGPIANLAANAGEVARVFACSTTLTYNLTKTRFDLIAKPFTNTLQHMKSDIVEIQDTFKELQVILNDLKLGLSSDDDRFSYYKHLRTADNSTGKQSKNFSFNSQLPKAAEIQLQFVRKMGNRCKQQLDSGHEVCEEVFSQGFRKCATNFPNWLANAICWPYRIDIICKVNMFGNPDKVCDASKFVPSDFGQNYVKLLQTEQELYGNSSNIQITYKLQNSSTAAQLRSAQQTSQEFLKDFEQRRRIFNAVMEIIDKFMWLFIFYLIWSAANYNWNYRCVIDFDNFYITDYFKHVDARRKRMNEGSLLPLRSLEKSRIVDLQDVCSRTVAESSQQSNHILQFLLEILPTVLFLLLDRMVVNMLNIINHRSLISYEQEGEHEVRFRINGTGLMARLLRTTMKNFNIHERVSTFLTNEECLPVPHKLPLTFYVKLIALYALIILLIHQNIFISRMRPVICNYFYYKREKQRTLFLYGSLLRNRATYLHDMRQTAEQNLATRHSQGQLNIFLMLRLGYPQKFGWLTYFQCAKRKCLICSCVENDRFVICKYCEYPYCRNCSRDMTFVCIFCEQLMSRQKANENTVEFSTKERTSNN
ncbi:protein sneaky [Drosophila sulfurigaster albostrigata]|uniref:protein sneaky n=1 Tax=Drosophila sulfurigaster albostrigata TaxID=89887 RepID=UPI002D21A750|nr:protein sneaky [Drosophila sulfurigaster albostrigata]